MSYSCRMLPDVPSDVDVFGSHQRLAEALGGMIMDDTTGKAIALIGGWGSGKSTVVNLLTSFLNKKSAGNVRVFLFDAWAHEGDPLRRSFLERLTLCLETWIEDFQSWSNGPLEELRRRKKTQDIQTTPYLKSWGIVIIFSIFLVPFGFYLFESGVKHLSPLEVALGAILSLAPVVVAIFIVLFNKKEFKDRGLGILAGLFINKTIERIRSTSVETPEPTSVEFEDYYSRVLKQSLDASPKRKLCIVIDNLDRLDHVDAIRLIATLKPFLQPKQNEPWMKNITYIIPFDEQSLIRLWSQQPKRPNGKNNQEESLGKPFLEKVFQIKLFVPKQLLSDWQHFLREGLKKAFDSIDEKDTYRIIRIYDVAVASKNQITPTPRQLISFVNHIVGVYHQWHDEIPLAHQSIYVVLRTYWDCHDLEDLRGRLNELVTFSEYSMGERLEDDIAALYLNVEREKARELWMEPEVETSLKAGDSEYFVSNKLKKGLSSLVDAVISKRINDWKDKDPKLLINGAFALRDTTFQEPSELLKRKIQEITVWSFLDQAIASKIVQIFRGERDVLLKITNSAGRVSEQKEGEPPRGILVNGILTIINGLEKQFPDIRPGEVQLTVTPAIYVQILSIAAQSKVRPNDPRLLTAAKVDVPEVVAFFKETITQGRFDLQFALALKLFLSITGPDERLFDLSEALFVRANVNAQLPISEINALSITFLALRTVFSDPKSMFRLQLRESVELGWLFHHYHFVMNSDEKAKDAQANLTLLLSLEPVRSWRTKAQYGQHGYNYFANNLSDLLQKKPELTDQISSGVIECRLLGDALTILEEKNSANAKALTPVIASVIRRGDSYRLFGDSAIIEHFDLIRTVAAEDSKKLISEAAEGTITKTLVDNSFTLNSIPLIMELLGVKGSEENQLIRWIENGIVNVDSKRWHDEITGTSSGVVQLSSQLAKQLSGKLGQPLYNALQLIIDEIKNKTIEHKGIRADFLDIAVGLLDRTYAETLKRNCRDSLIKDTGADAMNSYIETFFPLLIDSDIMAEKSDDFVRQILSKVPAKAVDIELATKLISSCPTLWTSAKQASKRVFKEELQRAIEAETDTERQEKMVVMSSLLENLK